MDQPLRIAGISTPGSTGLPFALTFLLTSATWAQTKTMTPLEIPKNFNPATSMIARQDEQGTFHATRLAAEYAASLVENGTPTDLARAEEVIAAHSAWCNSRHLSANMAAFG